MAEEQIRADRIGVGNTIKHPETSESVKVADTRKFGQGSHREEPQPGEPSREWTGVYVTLESGEELTFKNEDEVTRRRD
ncbi:hypothetical protein ACAG24_017650 [Mycobacterium sp. pW049]|uniref:hypothetical protein n=1 Tax=[Mycobacterium] bulgaricum TaxID=3238985 RepID=UPI00351BE8EA